MVLMPEDWRVIDYMEVHKEGDMIYRNILLILKGTCHRLNKLVLWEKLRPLLMETMDNCSDKNR